MAPGHEPDLNRLAAFVDHTLAPAERPAMVEHLASCRQCRDVLGSLTRHLPVTRSAGRWPWLLPAAAAIATLLIGGGALWMNLLERIPQPAPTTIPPTALTSPQSPAPPASSPILRQSQQAVPDEATRTSKLRHLGGKTFRLVAGEWIDTAYDSAALLPVRTITTAAARDAEIASTPSLAPFLALGRRVTVVVGGIVYRMTL